MAFTTSVVFVGNLDGDIETIVRTSNLFYPMPKEMDTAFYDRIHAYIPGWEFQKTHDDIYTNHFGLVTDYLAEVFKEVRKCSYAGQSVAAVSLLGKVTRLHAPDHIRLQGNLRCPTGAHRGGR